MSVQIPTDEEIAEAVNLVMPTHGCGVDKMIGSESIMAEVRSKLPEEFRFLSLMLLGKRAVNIRKSKPGLINSANGRRGQRSESELESEGTSLEELSRNESRDEYRWTNDPVYKKNVRPLVLERDGHKCQFCYSTERLNVHHRSYKNCRTRLEVDDCITLCKTCHNGLHEIWRKRRSGKPSPLQLELSDVC